jgi:hypothetical protein
VRSAEAHATVRAVGPPLTLLALGGLFLADYHLGWPIVTTWPALLVLAGLLQVLAQLTRPGNEASE